jgi:hypothetical protein
LTADVFLAVLAAAFMHAGWNALIKIRLDPFLSISLMSVAMGAISLACLPFVAVPTGWTPGCGSGSPRRFMSATSCSWSTPTSKANWVRSIRCARGTAPLLTALGGGRSRRRSHLAPHGRGDRRFVPRHPAHVDARRQHRGENDRTTVLYALGTSAFIAAYTLVDGVGGRSAPSASSYTVWLFVLDGFSMGFICTATRGRRRSMPCCRLGAVGLANRRMLSLGAYWIIIWAMTQAPIAAVAALARIEHPVRGLPVGR